MKEILFLPSFYGQNGLKNLEHCLHGLLFAGTDTVSAFLEWFIMYMTAFQDVQEKCHEELDRVVGNGNVTIKDKGKTPFMEATVQGCNSIWFWATFGPKIWINCQYLFQNLWFKIF